MCAATQDWWNRVPPENTAKGDESERIVQAESALEQMPHLAQKVCLLWDTGDFEAWVDKILMDARDGMRQGLPWPAAEEMLFLVQLRLVKRAIIAAEVTGLPFSQVVRQMRAAAEAALHAAQWQVGPWGSPRADRRQSADRRNTHARRRRDKVPWWRRMFR